MSYQADHIERRNRRKAIILTTLIYGGLMTFFLVKDDIAWKDYLPTVVVEMMGEEAPAAAVAETTADIRP